MMTRMVSSFSKTSDNSRYNPAFGPQFSKIIFYKEDKEIFFKTGGTFTFICDRSGSMAGKRI